MEIGSNRRPDTSLEVSIQEEQEEEQPTIMPTNMSMIRSGMNRVAPVDASFSLEQSQNDALDADPSKLDQQEQISFKFPKEKAKQRRQRLAEALQLQ